MKKNTEKNFALSLNAAYFGFFAHAGFLAGLEEAGYKPSRISGASAGAFVASLYAFGISPAEMIETFVSVKKKDFWEGNPFTHFGKIFSKGLKGYSGILNGHKLKELIRPFLKDKKIENANIPLYISVANLTKRKSEVRVSGNALDTVIASMAFPFLFEVQKLDEEEFLDGGLADEEPIKQFILDMSVKTIVTHDVVREEKTPRSLIKKSIDNSISVIASETRELKELLANKYGKKILRLQSHTPAIDENHLSLGVKAIEVGRKTGQSLSLK
jgi:NTE family protein